MENDLTLFAKSNSSLLITGKNGIGKSQLAKQIHQLSPRRSRPFVTAHLASLTQSLFESELFGHAKGSFTGAISAKEGYLDRVQGGTLFLDEVAEISIELQKKLLLLLEERIYFAVGSPAAKNFKGKVVAATNKNLLDLVKEGKFREDLFYRLRVFQLDLKPLVESPVKLLFHINQYFELFKTQEQRLDLSLSNGAMKRLKSYGWPGNIREVKNCMEYIVTTCPGNLVELKNLPTWIEEVPGSAPTAGQYHDALNRFECLFLSQALERNRGKINQTCSQVGISKSTLLAKVKKYGINVLQMKSDSFKKSITDYGIQS
ncbi:MAG: sigma-54-dependent Fis family transcriptional regulator [Halobacteriovoraceae bacterium]|nr:sigma-54-dependent Fis family transcriptional regulator [Halobacteriovoraceae bacterium]